MKVKELIKALKKADPDLEVYTSQYHAGTSEYDDGWDEEKEIYSAEEGEVWTWDSSWTKKRPIKVFVIK